MVPRLEKPNVSPIRSRLYDSLKDLVRADRCQVGQKLPTSRELAAHFDVSLATAQAAVRMLEKDGFVSCEVGRGTYVRRTLEPSEAPQRTANGIPTIGVLTGLSRESDLEQPARAWSASIVFGIQQGLMEQGYGLHMIPFEAEIESLSVAEKKLSKLSSALAGLISFPIDQEDELLSLADRLGLPWVTINQYNHLSTRNYVTADYYGGGVEVGKLFARLGLERILFLREKHYSYSGLQKENGLRDGLSASGISPNHVEVRVAKDYLVRDGYEETLRFLDEAKRPPQGIFTTGDLLALGAIKTCQEHGLRVPGEVAVVGSTGIEAGEHSNPTLTTVRQPMGEMGIEAANMLLSLIRKKESHTAGKILPVQLVQRGSTPPLPTRRR